MASKSVQHWVLSDEAKVAAGRTKQCDAISRMLHCTVVAGWAEDGCLITNCSSDGIHRMRCSSSGRSDYICHTKYRQRQKKSRVQSLMKQCNIIPKQRDNRLPE